MRVEDVYGTVVAYTEVCKTEVEYGVQVPSDTPDEWRTVWKTTVKFGKDAAHRAGGYAFMQAATKQSMQAQWEIEKLLKERG